MCWRHVEIKLRKGMKNVIVDQGRSVKKTTVATWVVNSCKVPIVALGFAVVTATFVHLGTCVERKIMNVTLQSTAMESQIYAQMTVISLMEPLASITPFVSERGAVPDMCSAKTFLELMPGRLLISAITQLI